jgi:hypothetical protein
MIAILENFQEPMVDCCSERSVGVRRGAKSGPNGPAPRDDHVPGRLKSEPTFAGATGPGQRPPAPKADAGWSRSPADDETRPRVLLPPEWDPTAPEVASTMQSAISDVLEVRVRVTGSVVCAAMLVATVLTGCTRSQDATPRSTPRDAPVTPVTATNLVAGPSRTRSGASRAATGRPARCSSFCRTGR